MKAKCRHDKASEWDLALFLLKVLANVEKEQRRSSCRAADANTGNEILKTTGSQTTKNKKRV